MSFSVLLYHTCCFHILHTISETKDLSFVISGENKTVYVKHIMWYLCTSAMRQINLIKMSSLDLYHIVSFSIMPLLLICMRLKFLLVDLKIFPGKKNLYLNSGDLGEVQVKFKFNIRFWREKIIKFKFIIEFKFSRSQVALQASKISGYTLLTWTSPNKWLNRSKYVVRFNLTCTCVLARRQRRVAW